MPENHGHGGTAKSKSNRLQSWPFFCPLLWKKEIRSRPSGRSLERRNRSASTFADLYGSESHARWNLPAPEKRNS